MTIKRKPGRPKEEPSVTITFRITVKLKKQLRKKFKRGELSSLGKAWLESLVKK